MKPNFDLTGRVAIVTGANSGIGRGIAEGLAGAGAAVVVAGRRTERNVKAANDIVAKGGKAIPIDVDVRNEASCQNLIDETVKRLGRLDILVNNAGTNVRSAPEDYKLEDYNFVMETNLTSAFMLSKAAYPHFKKAGGGKIINIGSMMSIFGSQISFAYGASKGGIQQMTRALTASWAKDNIQANCILPGWIDSELTQTGRQQVPGLNERVINRTPAGRWGEPEDLAGLAVFLASSASDFVNGAAIPVDGGYASLG
jgi:2-deoxy-D-gluconate 3-dehydrogenase